MSIVHHPLVVFILTLALLWLSASRGSARDSWLAAAASTATHGPIWVSSSPQP